MKRGVDPAIVVHDFRAHSARSLEAIKSLALITMDRAAKLNSWGGTRTPRNLWSGIITTIVSNDVFVQVIRGTSESI